MGWNLFRIGIVDPQSAELSSKSVTVKLQKCGPGVFFAVFGTAILIWAIYSPLTLTAPSNESTEDAPKRTAFNVHYEQQTMSPAAQLRRCQSINSLAVLFKQHPEFIGELPQPQRIAVAQAIQTLQEFKESIAAQQVGTDKLNWYKGNVDKFLVNESAYSPGDRQMIRDIMKCMSDLLP